MIDHAKHMQAVSEGLNQIKAITDQLLAMEQEEMQSEGQAEAGYENDIAAAMQGGQ